jgi:hypothetical protein
MHERESDPPGAVSNQNQEEAPSGLRDDESHPEPRTKHERPAKRNDEEQNEDAEGAGS